MSLSKYIHAMGRGPSRGRSLERAEAADAMAQILAGNVAPEAIGALLMLMRYRGETAEEIAGFTDAARARLEGWRGIGAALDWPSYAAGRSRGRPWFLLSALLISRAGHPVMLHGWNSHQNPVADVKSACQALAIPIEKMARNTQSALHRDGIVYVPLEGLSAELLNLLRLRDVLGLRSAVNTLCRMLNPTGAATMVQGVFHPSYRTLQQDAGLLLEQPNLMVIKGGGGEFERHPAKQCVLFGLQGGTTFETTAPSLVQDHRRLADLDSECGDVASLWSGAWSAPWAETIVTGTAALALRALTPELDLSAAQIQAESLWQNRQRKLAA